jgi:hypothetical protein
VAAPGRLDTLGLGPVRRTTSPPPAAFGWPPGPGPPGRVTIHLGGPEPLRTAGMPRHPTATGFHTARRPGSIQHRRSHHFAPHR